MARGSDTLTYDQANRLKSVTVGGASSTYTYDGDGKRASKTIGGQTTSYVYNVNRSLPVVLDDGSRKYVWGLGLAYAVDTAGGVQVYHTDGLGSVRAITDASGSAVQTYQTDEFGVPTEGQGSVNQPFQYTGEQRDAESGFVYLRARVYDPSIGRFTSKDPWSGTGVVPSTLNRYEYVQNNPVSLVDPSGLCPDGYIPSRGECEAEKWNMQSLAEEMAGRHDAMKRDPLRLWKGEHPEAGNWVGHQGRYYNLQERLNVLIDFYDKNCKARFGDLPAEVREWANKPAPAQPDWAKSTALEVDPSTAGEVAGAAAAAYIAYRVARMIPSLVPGLWETIPINAAVP